MWPLGRGAWGPGRCLGSSLLHILVPSYLTPHCRPADPARVLNMPPVIYVPVGIHGYIRCPVDAEPPATVVKWNKDGRPLQVEKVLEGCPWGPSAARLPMAEAAPEGPVPCPGSCTPHPTSGGAKLLGGGGLRGLSPWPRLAAALPPRPAGAPALTLAPRCAVCLGRTWAGP